MLPPVEYEFNSLTKCESKLQITSHLCQWTRSDFMIRLKAAAAQTDDILLVSSSVRETDWRRNISRQQRSDFPPGHARVLTSFPGASSVCSVGSYLHRSVFALSRGQSGRLIQGRPRLGGGDRPEDVGLGVHVGGEDGWRVGGTVFVLSVKQLGRCSSPSITPALTLWPLGSEGLSALVMNFLVDSLS